MKVLFIDSMPASYRLPCLQKLAGLFDTEFIFTHSEIKKVPGNLKARVIPNHVERAVKRILRALNRNPGQYSYYGIAFGLIPALLKNKFDVIIAGDTSSLQQLIETFICMNIARGRRKKFILYYGGWGGWKRKITGKAVTFMLRYMIKYADAIVAYGTRSRNFFINLGAEPGKVFMAFNTSLISGQIDKNRNNSIRKAFNIGNNKVVLFVGRLVKNKNPELLISAFSQIKRSDVHLMMIGDGEDGDELKKMCERLNIEGKVSFLGKIKNEDLPDYYGLCEVFVLPSSYEPWGLVLNEAMSFCKPVIATTGVGAVDDLIKNGINGFIVPKDDAGALYQAIERVLSDSDLSEYMGQESKKIIEQGFTYEYMVSGLKMAIETATQNKG